MVWNGDMDGAGMGLGVVVFSGKNGHQRVRLERVTIPLTKLSLDERV